MADHSALAEALRKAGAKLEPGAPWRVTFSDGGHEVEVSVVVRPSVTRMQLVAFRDQALAWLQEQESVHYAGSRAYRARRCGCRVNTGPAWARERDCSGRVAFVVVVVVSSPALPFRFVCSRHKERHGVDPKYVKAVVELPARLLEPVLKLDEEDRAVRAQRYRREDHADGDHGARADAQCEDCIGQQKAKLKQLLSESASPPTDSGTRGPGEASGPRTFKESTSTASGGRDATAGPGRGATSVPGSAGQFSEVSGG